MEKIKQHILAKENLAELVRLVNYEMYFVAAGHGQHLKTIIDGIADTAAVWRDCMIRWKLVSWG